MSAVAHFPLFQVLRHLGRVPTHVRFGAAVGLGAAAYLLAPAGLTAAGRAVVA